MFGKRLPDPFHWFISKSLLFILKIKSCKEPGIETHICKKSRICIRMTKRIYMPSYSRFDSKLLKKELMTNHHVVDHIFIVRTGFIMHAPTSVNKLKTTLLNELSNLSLHSIRLILPPHAKEFHLDIRKTFVRITNKFIDHCLYN